MKREYRVEKIRDYSFGGNYEPVDLEEYLNNRAEEGWILQDCRVERIRIYECKDNNNYDKFGDQYHLIFYKIKEYDK